MMMVMSKARGLGFSKPATPAPPQQEWMSYEMERRPKRSVQFSCREMGVHIVQQLKSGFHFCLYSSVFSLNWIFWRSNRIQSLWLHRGLDIEELFNIIFPSTSSLNPLLATEKGGEKKSVLPQRDLLAPLQGGAKPWCLKLRKDEQLLVDCFCLFFCLSWSKEWQERYQDIKGERK